jgi:hypothetical protein
VKLVSSLDQVLQNVEAYNAELEQFSAVMSNARAWYATRRDGRWLFAPSKVIGYVGVSAEGYFSRRYDRTRRGRVNPKNRDDDALDGRVTERVLAQWAQSLDHTHPHYGEVLKAFQTMFSEFRKKPSHAARISIIMTDEFKANLDLNDYSLVPLLLAAFKRLSDVEKREFRRFVIR